MSVLSVSLASLEPLCMIVYFMAPPLGVAVVDVDVVSLGALLLLLLLLLEFLRRFLLKNHLICSPLECFNHSPYLHTSTTTLRDDDDDACDNSELPIMLFSLAFFNTVLPPLMTRSAVANAISVLLRKMRGATRRRRGTFSAYLFRLELTTRKAGLRRTLSL